ncbi:GntR family transcriptional regulator [Rhizobium leguminosarum]|uniref:GntR family transcriptional regulator n=1 Tax=Rhizobium leguminosarum TaxID=384 RepID=UPI0009B7224F|nr:GntR family transcriptional regulator [Rhizobium leguminosarum]UIJ83215.1 GntR family transcriptional regulator [Rhizobium leguminosarum]
MTSKHSGLEPGLIDADSPVPVFVQVEQDIRRQILSGTLANGARLPRETELANMYGISRMTIRHALEGLATSGLIQRTHGIGTIVVAPKKPVTFELSLMISFTEQLRLQGLETETIVDLKSIVDPPEKVKTALALGDSEKCLVFRRVREVEGRPMAVTTSWLPHNLFPNIESLDLTGGSLWAALSENYGVHLTRTDNVVELVNASISEAHQLHIDEEAQVLRFSGTSYDASEKPIEYTVALWSGQVRFHFRSQRPTGSVTSPLSVITETAAP